MHFKTALIHAVFLVCVSATSKIHELFIQHFPGGHEGFFQSIYERSDWSPLQIFENSDGMVNAEREARWLNGWDRFDSLGPVIQCPKDILEVFASGDEEKRICGAIKGDDCVVISLGSNDQWAFEIDLIRKYPHCKIHTLDCYVVGHVPPEIQAQVTFHHYCIGITDHTTIKGNEYLTWQSIAAKIGLTKPPTALKMDIEGGEWITIPAIIKSNLFVPESFSFELHYESIVTDLKWVPRRRSAPELGLFSELMLNLGYVLVDRHDNDLCKHCTEIVMANLLPNMRFLHHRPFAANKTQPKLLNVLPYPSNP